MKKVLVSKRGFEASQLFMYITTVIVVGFVLLFGFKAVLNFQGSAESVEQESYIRDFQSLVKSVSVSYGTRRVFENNIPGGINRICMIDPNAPGDDVVEYCRPENGDREISDLICDDWVTLVNGNAKGISTVYLLNNNEIKSSFELLNIEIVDESHYACINSSKSVFVLEGKGKTVAVSVE